MNPNIAEAGKNTRFSKTNQPKKKRGRKPAKWKQLTKEFEISDIDKKKFAQQIITKLSKDDIDKILKDPKTPFGVIMTIKAIMTDAAKNGGRGMLVYVWDAGFGKNVDKFTEVPNEITDFTPEQRAQILAEHDREVIERYEREQIEQKKEQSGEE